MGWYDVNDVFGAMSEDESRREYNRDWVPVQQIIDRYEHALAGQKKYSREVANDEMEMGM